MPNFKNSNATFWVIFKQWVKVLFEFSRSNSNFFFGEKLNLMLECNTYWENLKIAAKTRLWIFALKIPHRSNVVGGTVWIQQRNFGPHTKIFPGNKCISIISFFLDTFSQRALWLDSRYHISQNRVDPEDQKNCWKGSLLIWMSSEHKCPFTSMSL